jgi:hypothetical protein
VLRRRSFGSTSADAERAHELRGDRGGACVCSARGPGRSERVDHRRYEGTGPRRRIWGRRRTRSGPGQVACSKTEDSESSSAVGTRATGNRSVAKCRDSLADTDCRRDGGRFEAHGNRRALEPPPREAVAPPPSPAQLAGSLGARDPLCADRLHSRSTPGHGRHGPTRIGRTAPASSDRALPCGAGRGLAASATRRPASARSQVALTRPASTATRPDADAA